MARLLRVAATIGLAFAAVVPLSQAQSSSVLLNLGYADNPIRPTQFGPSRGPGNFSGVRDYVRDLTWDSWGSEQATGTGQVRLLEDRASTSPVAVTLAGLKQCAGKSVYTTYSLALAEGAAQPKLWPDGSTGTFPCRIVAGYFNNNDPGTKPGGPFGCVLTKGLGGKWTPKLPRGSAYSGLCAMRWTTWAQPAVTGKGVMRNGSTQWGAKAQLSAPAWCPRQAMSYTRLRMTIYGTGEAIPGGGNVTKRDADRLRRTVDRPGVKKRVYQQTLSGCQS